MAAGEEQEEETFWLKFFREADIPDSHAASYAEVFDDNRIRSDMLQELNKDILQEMGVAVMGDVIAILRHAKQCHANMLRAAQKKIAKRSPKVKVAVVQHLQQQVSAPVIAAPVSAAPILPTLSVTQKTLDSLNNMKKFNALGTPLIDQKARQDAIKRKRDSRLEQYGGSHGYLNPDGDFTTDPPPMDVDPKIEQEKTKRSQASKLASVKSPPKKEHVSVHQRLGGKGMKQKPKPKSNNKKTSTAQEATSPNASVFARLGGANGKSGANSSNRRQVTVKKSGSKGSVFSRLNA